MLPALALSAKEANKSLRQRNLLTSDVDFTFSYTLDNAKTVL